MYLHRSFHLVLPSFKNKPSHTTSCNLHLHTHTHIHTQVLYINIPGMLLMDFGWCVVILFLIAFSSSPSAVYLYYINCVGLIYASITDPSISPYIIDTGVTESIKRPTATCCVDIACRATIFFIFIFFFSLSLHTPFACFWISFFSFMAFGF